MTTSIQIRICPMCHRESAGFCERDQNRLHRSLGDLQELWEAAHDELLPGNGGRGSSSGELTIGLNVAALSWIAATDILGTLHAWEVLTRKAHPEMTPPAFIKKPELLATEIQDAVRFAQENLRWMGTQEWAGDFAAEINDLHQMGMAAARKFVEKVRRIDCPADTKEGLPCGRTLKVRDDDLLGIVTCKGCGSDWTPLRLVKVSLAAPEGEIWLDTEAIAAWIGLSERRVRQIAAKHQVPRRGPLVELKSFNRARGEIGA